MPAQQEEKGGDDADIIAASPLGGRRILKQNSYI